MLKRKVVVGFSPNRDEIQNQHRISHRPCAPFGGVAGLIQLRSAFRILRLRSRKLFVQLVSNGYTQQCWLGSTYASRQYGYTCVFGASWVG